MRVAILCCLCACGPVANPAERVEAVLTPTASFVGRVVGGVAPVANQSVRFDEYSTLTDSNGYFYFHGVSLSDDPYLPAGNHVFDIPSSAAWLRKLARQTEATLTPRLRGAIGAFVIPGEPSLFGPSEGLSDIVPAPQSTSPTVLSGDTTQLTNAHQAPANCAYSGAPAPDDVYTFAIATDQELDISLTSLVFDTVLMVADARTGAVVGCNDDSQGTTNSHLTLTLAPGVYSIVADGYYAFGHGAYTLSIGAQRRVAATHGAPAFVATASHAFSGDITQAADAHHASCAASGAPGRDATYTLDLPYRAKLQLDTFGTHWDTVLYVIDTKSGATIACNDDSVGTLQSQITQTFEPGTYSLVVDGYSANNSGPFALNAIAIDDCGGSPCYDVSFQLTPVGNDSAAIDSMDPVAGLVVDTDNNQVEDVIQTYLTQRWNVASPYGAFAYGCPANSSSVVIPSPQPQAAPPVPDLDAWLNANPAIAQATIWQYNNGATASWPIWTATMKQDLRVAFATSWSWYYAGLQGEALPVVDPPNNLDPGDGVTVLSDADAWKLYVAYLAQTLAIEIGGWLPWSIKNYDPNTLAMQIDSRQFVPWSGLFGGYTTVYWSTPGRAADAFSFLSNNGMIRQSKCATISALIEWTRENLHHWVKYANESRSDITNDYWQYRGHPPAARVLAGTTNPFEGFAHWTLQCQGTTGFYASILRAVNIPSGDAANANACGHALPWFPTESRYLSHGDEPYNADFKVMPYGADTLLINPAVYHNWFDPQVKDCDNDPNNVDRRSTELDLSFLGPTMVSSYCSDLAHNRTHANGTVFSNISCCIVRPNLLAYLEAIHLWDNLQAKVNAAGGCP